MSQQHSVELAAARSISHDEIVVVMVDDVESAYATLIIDQSEWDSVDYTGQYGAAVKEVWGTNDDGEDWRVHLIGPVDSNCEEPS